MAYATIQQINDALDQYTVRIDANQVSAAKANTEANRALTTIYDVELGSRVYTNFEIQRLKDDIRAEFQQADGSKQSELLAALSGEISSSLPNLLSDYYGSYADMQALYTSLVQRFGESDSAIDVLINSVLPGIQLELDTLNNTSYDISANFAALSQSLKAVLIVYAETADGQNQSLEPENRQYIQYVEYTEFPPNLPVGGSFVKFVGTSTSVWPIYADDAEGSNQSLTPGNRSWVTFYEGTQQPGLPVTGQTFVRYVGEDGASQYFATAFIRTSGTPGRPTGGSYDFTNQTLNAPSGWSNAVPSGSNPLWVSTAKASIQGQTGVDYTLSWSTPVMFAQNGNDGARGPGRWDIGTSYMPSSSSQVDAVWNSGSGSQPSRPVIGDQVWIYTGPQGSPTDQKVYVCTAVYSDTSHAWAYMDTVIRGNLLVEDSIFASALKIGDASLESDGSGGLVVKGGGITVLKDNFYTAQTPLYGNGFSNPPNTFDLSLVGGNIIQIPPYFTADLQIVVSFEHGYYNLSGYNDDWGCQIIGFLQGAVFEEELYARYNPTMTLESDYATIAVIKKNIINSTDEAKNYSIYVKWGGGSSDIRLMNSQTSVFMRFK